MFKIGDKVRGAVDIYDVVEKNKVYTVRSVSGDKEWLYLEEAIVNPWNAHKFELAFPPLPDLRDLASVVKPTPFMSERYYIKPNNWLPSAIMVGLIHKSCQPTPPTTTKIIHNGTTTITMFSDGTKIITRPSPDDVEKFDPFIGWCVGVVEKLYGGKEKAKRFYKEHAVVQKCMRKVEEPADWNEVVETVKVEKARKDCDNCKHHNSSVSGEQCRQCLEDYSQGMLVTKWEPKEQKC